MASYIEAGFEFGFDALETFAPMRRFLPRSNGRKKDKHGLLLPRRRVSVPDSHALEQKTVEALSEWGDSQRSFIKISRHNHALSLSSARITRRIFREYFDLHHNKQQMCVEEFNEAVSSYVEDIEHADESIVARLGEVGLYGKTGYRIGEEFVGAEVIPTNDYDIATEHTGLIERLAPEDSLDRRLMHNYLPHVSLVKSVSKSATHKALELLADSNVTGTLVVLGPVEFDRCNPT